MVCLAGPGCGRSVPEVNLAANARAQLRAIAKAYMDATDRLNRPPHSKDELLPDVKLVLSTTVDPNNPETITGTTMSPADVLRSPNDGDEFVILWGVDVREINPAGPRSELPVLAYEKRGKDGKRLVLQLRFVREVTDEQFAGLPFPRGVKRPE
jgi:hypothetical protein